MKAKENIIYIRGIKRLKNTVLCVDSEDQKFYYDPITKTKVGFSSGSQVKRCIRERMVENLNTNLAKVVINYTIDNNTLKQSNPEGNADPLNLDSLVFGWMKTSSKEEVKDNGKGKKKGKKDKKVAAEEEQTAVETEVVETETEGTESDTKTKTVEGVTKTSAISISSLTPLHPYLATLRKGEIQTLDRLDKVDECTINIFTGDGKNKQQLTEDEIKEFLSNNNRMMPKAIYTAKSHLDGVFSFDIAIDLRTLFSVQVHGYKAQITKEKELELLEKGWVYGKNEFGEILLAPKDVREKITESLSDALVDWQFKTNQSSNYSPSVTEAMSISFDVRRAAYGLSAEVEEKTAQAIIDLDYADNVFVEKSAKSYLKNSEEIAKAFAMDDAKAKIVEMINSYDYEQYLNK